jgi:NNP family nitrate/nitrite transporter-like MFS transporter
MTMTQPAPAAATGTLGPGNPMQLALATLAFGGCFAVFGSASAMMPLLRQRLDLSAVEVSVALAVPVLLGSLGRIPLGMMTDRLGGRAVFAAVMAAAIVPAGLLGGVSQYWQLLVCGFFLGIGLASFSVGVGFVSAWYPPQKQGTALGIYGAGSGGQSLAAFGAPLLAGMWGYAWGFWSFALLTLACLALWLLLARDAPSRGAAKSWSDFAEPLKTPMSWVLSLYYFLTFGGFVAMAIYLPIFLTETFQLARRDAGLRTAGFVVLATAMRPLGGILADRVGGRLILRVVFPLTALMAVLLACPMMSTFTIGALGMAAAIGLGNGAVFKLVPDYYPKAVGSVTGLVGAAGGLGGFFPPLVLGGIYEMTGQLTWGFILLAVFCLACWAMSWTADRKTVPLAATQA